MVLVIPGFLQIGQRFILQQIVDEKRTKMRETLRIMSLSQFNYAFSFFVTQLFPAIVAGVVLAFGFQGDTKVFPMDPNKNSYLFGLAVFVYSVASIPFCMSISTLFNDGRLANQVGSMLLFLPMLLVLYYLNQTDANGNPTNNTTLYWFYWIPTIPSALIFLHLADNDYNPMKVSQYNETSMWLALVGNSFLWFMIYRYLDAIIPSEFGIQKHWLFCLKSSKKLAPVELTRDDLEKNENVFSEGDPIKFNKLTKKFGKFTAVKDLQFSIREGEVFTFLGHNGAGKTTTIYMLTGMLKASAGDAHVYGFSINKEADLVQKNLGLCQQFDILYENLTVKEHLELVCELKNIDPANVEQTVKEAMQVVLLTEHSHKLSKELSGGMKRKLSLAMAIVGNPKLIILDEPTSGLDVESRK